MGPWPAAMGSEWRDEGDVHTPRARSGPRARCDMPIRILGASRGLCLVCGEPLRPEMWGAHPN
eukprot:3172125-Prymnesium_polylepis.1